MINNSHPKGKQIGQGYTLKPEGNMSQVSKFYFYSTLVYEFKLDLV